MLGLLADANIQGHVKIPQRILEGPVWGDFWQRLNLPIHAFKDLGLPTEASDATVWRFCQEHQLVLLTANRNKTGPDSLEAVIEAENGPDKLPVLTLANP